jgi:hypothetical protein
MKTTIFLLIIALYSLSFAQTPIKADITENATEQIVRIVGAVDSLTTYFTDPPAHFNGFINDSTISLAYAKKDSSVKGKPKITVIAQVDYGNGLWFNTDTMFVADSLETAVSGAKTITKIGQQYRFLIIGSAGNRRDAQIDLVFYCKKRDIAKNFSVTIVGNFDSTLYNSKALTLAQLTYYALKGDTTTFLAYVKALFAYKLSISDSTTFLAYIKALDSHRLSYSDSTTFLAYIKAIANHKQDNVLTSDSTLAPSGGIFIGSDYTVKVKRRLWDYDRMIFNYIYGIKPKF